jgi:DNA invertase Pin-like site-specific DNA recombinase
MFTYGYACISAPDHDYGRQIEELNAEDCEIIFREKSSAVRPQLVKLMKGLQAGDRVIVTKLDRLGRSTRELLELIEFITAKGAFFKSLGDPIFDTTGPTGRLLSPLLAAIAEFERTLISKRTSAGRARAKERGVVFGRKSKLTLHQQQEAKKRLSAGESQIDIARSYNVHPSCICRFAKKIEEALHAA